MESKQQGDLDPKVKRVLQKMTDYIVTRLAEDDRPRSEQSKDILRLAENHLVKIILALTLNLKKTPHTEKALSCLEESHLWIKKSISTESFFIENGQSGDW